MELGEDTKIRTLCWADPIYEKSMLTRPGQAQAKETAGGKVSRERDCQLGPPTTSFRPKALASEGASSAASAAGAASPTSPLSLRRCLCFTQRALAAPLSSQALAEPFLGKGRVGGVLGSLAVSAPRASPIWNGDCWLPSGSRAAPSLRQTLARWR
jgi:hypothetical protein